MSALLVISLGALAYIYVGYLVALRLLVWAKGPRSVRRASIAPDVTLVISAYNEAAVIRKKIDNALALDYPAGRLEIVVVSDASDDGTDEIVEQYSKRGVRLFRQQERRGKTAGLNAVLPTARGEIVVFSDANAIYKDDALRLLVRNFADPDVGCVTGEARYLPSGNTIADAGERLYWSYEMQIKRLETALGSMVGGDGAIYAIRKALWQPLPENAINDFLNPLQIVAGGWRAVYEPEAVCFEETAGAARAEYRRRVRIVSRSWRAVFQAGSVLNPLRVGYFAWSIVSHKVLRWMSGAFMAVAVVAGAILYGGALQALSSPLAVAVLLAVLALLSFRAVRRPVAMIGYFAAINAASLVGMVYGSLGRVSGVWSTPRQHGVTARRMTLPAGHLLVGAAAFVLGAIAAGYRIDIGTPMEWVFWGSISVLAYTYFGYPLVLSVLKKAAPRPVRRRPTEPSVCLFIAAHNEGEIILAKLHNALALDYPAERLQIVVASDGSTDRTNAIARTFAPRVQLLDFQPRRGKIAVINDGMKSVTSDIVVLSDANTFLEPDAIRALVQCFADPTVGAVSGDVMLVGKRADLARSEDLYYWYERWAQHSESVIGSMIGVDGALYAIRRDLFTSPADDTILDDMAIPMAVIRAGYRVVFEPTARAYEQGSASALEEFSRKIRVTAGAVQFLARSDSAVPLGAWQSLLSLFSHKALRWLSPVFATAAFLASLFLARSSASYALAAIVQSAILLFGIAGCVPRLRRNSVVAFMHYFCLVQAAAGVGLFRGLSGGQSVRWRRFSRVPAELT